MAMYIYMYILKNKSMTITISRSAPASFNNLEQGVDIIILDCHPTGVDHRRLVFTH